MQGEGDKGIEGRGGMESWEAPNLDSGRRGKKGCGGGGGGGGGVAERKRAAIALGILSGKSIEWRTNRTGGEAGKHSGGARA